MIYEGVCMRVCESLCESVCMCMRGDQLAVWLSKIPRVSKERNRV